MFWALQSEFVTNAGIGRDLLLQSDALDGETLELFLELQGVVNEWREQKREEARHR